MKTNWEIKNELILHVIFWFAFLCFLFFSTIETTGLTKISLITSSALVGCYLPLVYLNIFVLHYILPKKQYLSYFLFYLIVVVIGGFILQTLFVKIFDITRHPVSWILYLAFILLFTSGLKFGYESFRQHLAIQRMKAKQLETELDLLKSQLNPHFFFNTLNNIYYLANEECAEKTAEGISTLSHLMRYMVYEKNVREIPLEKEVEQINRYIHLQKLKFSKEDKVTIEFRVEGDSARVMIPPMIFFPFVENAFKHGIRLIRSSEIYISINVSSKKLGFSVKNTFHENISIKNEQGGIGIENARKRMELIFPQQYQLDIRKDEGYHLVKLVLNRPDV